MNHICNYLAYVAIYVVTIKWFSQLMDEWNG